MLAALAPRLTHELAVHRMPSALLALALGVGAILLRWPAPDTPAFTLLALACGPLVIIDARTHRLPDAITAPTAVLGAVLLTAAAAFGTPTLGDLSRAALGAVALGGAYLALALIRPGGLGLGDVKLAGILGLYLAWSGWSAVLWGTVAAFVLGGAWAIALLVAQRATRHTAVAFGPFMVAGAALALLGMPPSAPGT